MFRPISKLQSIRRTLSLCRSARHCSGNANNNMFTFDSDELNKRINLREQWSKSLDKSSGSQMDFKSFDVSPSEYRPQSEKLAETSSKAEQNQKPFPVEEQQKRVIGQEFLYYDKDNPSGQKQPFWNEKKPLTAAGETTEESEPTEQMRVRLNRPESLQMEMAQLKKKIQSCVDVTDLFDLIKPHMNRLTSVQVEATCDKMNNLYYEARKDTSELAKYQKIVNTSPIFRSFLNRVNYLLVNLEGSCLISVLHTFSLLHQDPSTQIVRNTVQLLQTKKSQISLNDSVRCLFVLDSYMQSIPTKSKTLLALNQELISLARSQILTSEYDQDDIDAISRYYFIFLKSENDPEQAALKHLTENLLNPEVQLNLNNSVKLLRRIKQSHIEFRAKKLRGEVSKQSLHRLKTKELYPKILGQLIDKCNSVIYETLYLHQSDDDLHFYFVNIHDCVDTLNFEFSNFYDPKLLNFLVPYLLRVSEWKNYYKFFIYYLAQNYDKHLVYDESLLHFVYEQYCSDENFRSKVDFSQLYTFLTKYQIPFVDHQRIANAALESSYFLNSSTKFSYNSMKVLTSYLLNDGNDEQFLVNLISKIPNIEPKYYRTLSIKEYKAISLAKTYLSLFGNSINESLKYKIEYSMDIVFANLLECNRKPPITEMYFEIDNRLQRSGFLADGLCLDAFGIYDKSTNSLVPLTPFTAYFDSVDNIPLSESQQM